MLESNERDIYIQTYVHTFKNTLQQSGLKEMNRKYYRNT